MCFRPFDILIFCPVDFSRNHFLIKCTEKQSQYFVENIDQKLFSRDAKQNIRIKCIFILYSNQNIKVHIIFVLPTLWYFDLLSRGFFEEPLFDQMHREKITVFRWELCSKNYSVGMQSRICASNASLSYTVIKISKCT